MRQNHVLATAGRDAGMYFVVVAADEHFVWLANGKRRTLANPKRKNKKHVQQTATVIALTSWTDKPFPLLLPAYFALQVIRPFVKS